MDESEKAQLAANIQESAEALIQDGGWTKDDVIALLDNL